MAKFEHQCGKCQKMISSDTSEERLMKNITQHNWLHHSKNSPKRRRAAAPKRRMLPDQIVELPIAVQEQLDYQRQGMKPALNLRDAEAMGQLIQTCVVFYNAIGALAAKLV